MCVRARVCVCARVGMYNFGFRSMCHKCSRLRPAVEAAAGSGGESTAMPPTYANADAGAGAGADAVLQQFASVVARVEALESTVKELAEANALLRSYQTGSKGAISREPGSSSEKIE